MHILPIFKGWTVDARLKQFRRVAAHGWCMDFVEFDSDKGDRLLTQYIKTLDKDSEEFNEIARAIL